MKCTACKKRTGDTVLVTRGPAGILTAHPDTRPDVLPPFGFARVFLFVVDGACQLHASRRKDTGSKHGKKAQKPKMTSIVPGPWGELKEARG